GTMTARWGYRTAGLEVPADTHSAGISLNAGVSTFGSQGITISNETNTDLTVLQLIVTSGGETYPESSLNAAPSVSIQTLATATIDVPAGHLVVSATTIRLGQANTSGGNTGDIGTIGVVLDGSIVMQPKKGEVGTRPDATTALTPQPNGKSVVVDTGGQYVGGPNGEIAIGGASAGRAYVAEITTSTIPDNVATPVSGP
ncbi:MAG TPA: hypothetical protein VFQ54_03490, partial [Thermomicrobiales bacterium]|nr:hypothetical protein [Thermomicrobiales bacterium]